MHPEIRRENPGMCPECGMALIKKRGTGNMKHGSAGRGKNGEDFDKHAGHSTRAFKKKFWLSLFLSIPVVLYSDVVAKLSGWTAPAFTGSGYLPFILASVIFFYGGWIFIASAWRELRARMPGMMTLISLAILAAYAYSVYAVLGGREHTLFWELSTLITVMLLGHWLEMRAVGGAQSALKELSKLLPDIAEVMVHGTENAERGATKIVPLEDIKLGDIVLVRPGGKIPVDGVVVKGASETDESLATGESRPVIKREGSETIAGTANGDGSLQIKVTKIGEHTFLAGVMRFVREAQASKSRLQLLSDSAAFYLTVIAVLTGVFTLVWWLAARAGVDFAVERFVAVLVIACPHALGLAIPLVASISTTKAAQNGFLVRKRLDLEMARKITAVLFDKTGTLTSGEYGVTNIWAIKATGEKELLRLAASVDSRSEHQISKAIVGEAKKSGVGLGEVSDFVRLPGRGAKGIVDGREIKVGGEAILEGKFDIPAPVREEAKKGKTIIYALRGNELLGAFALGDVVRIESREAVKKLREAGIKVAMITGDSEEVARYVAEDLGIDEYFARVLPQEKSGKVKILQAKGEKVAMVGDGINDAPALMQADLGIAIGAGTNVAIESAGIILVRNDPRDIPKIIRLSRLTYSKMLQNLFWASGYNVLAIPLAAGILASRGLVLEPALAAIFMSLSTIIVAVNAVLLRRKSLS